MSAPKVWTPERQAQLAALVAKTLTATAIGRIMGFTEEAIGKRCRRSKLKLLGNAGRAATKKAAKKPEDIQPKIRSSRAFVESSVFVPSEDTPMLSILELVSMDQCRFPFTCDDGETRYCGRLATNLPYCAHHFKMTHSGKPEPRVRGGRGFVLSPIKETRFRDRMTGAVNA